MAIVVLSLALCTASIVVMATKVRHDVDALATANTDNMQWNLSQMEVELLMLDSALLRSIKNGGSDLAEARKRFDIFYSRISTLRQSPLYANLRQEPDFRETLDQTWAFLQETVPFIDGPDAELVAAIPSIDIELDALRPQLRALSLRGIVVFASESDGQRQGVAQTLVIIAGLTVAMIAALVALAAMLFRQYSNLRSKSRDMRMTSTRLEAVIASSLDGVLVVSRTGRVIDFNGAAQKLFGYSKEEAVGAELGELIVPDHLRAAHSAGMERYLKTGEKRVVGKGRVQLDAKRKNGEVFPVECSISSTESENGEIFVAFLRDISERIAAEKELLQARDDALAGEKAKAELLAVMSHEMRTPLNGMLGTLELIEDTELSARQKEYLDIIGTSGRMLLHHVNDVLDISRLDSGMADLENTPLDLSMLLDEVCESQRPIAVNGGNELNVSFGDMKGQLVLGNDLRLRQVLLNILGNAAKFTRNGTINVEMERIDDGDDVEIRITDTGIGISKEDITRIFDDFVTLDSSYGRTSAGTGLGLGIAKRLVELMGGQIGAEGVLGKGSMFWVRIPLPRPLGKNVDQLHYEKSLPRARETPPMNVLVVEDNHINRLVVREMLEKEGHTVTEAHDGEEGVLLADQFRFDMVLMDISMPRMDGVKATQTIRGSSSASADVPIIALTAHALPDELDKFHEAGMNDVVVKPVSRSTLRSMLAKVASGTGPDIAPQSSDLQPLDLNLLKDLREGLGEAKLDDLLTKFLDETDVAMEQLTGKDALHISAPDFVMLVHKSAGSSAMLGATQLRERLVEVETAIKGDAMAKASELMADVPVIWTQTHAAIMAEQHK